MFADQTTGNSGLSPEGALIVFADTTFIPLPPSPFGPGFSIDYPEPSIASLPTGGFTPTTARVFNPFGPPKHNNSMRPLRTRRRTLLGSGIKLHYIQALKPRKPGKRTTLEIRSQTDLKCIV